MQTFGRKTEREDMSQSVGVDGKITLEWILRKYGGKVWNGCIWIRIGTSGGLL
jgi:hypothetical protein